MGFFRRTLTGSSSRQLSTSSSSNNSTDSANSNQSTTSHPQPITGATTPTPSLPLSSSSSPNSSSPPSITLTKTPSRLSKTFSWGTSRRKEDKEKKRLEDWERCDLEEWCAPTKRRGGKNRSQKHEEILRAFEWKLPRSSMEGGKSRSMFSGVSPGCSRMGSVDDGALERVLSGGRKGSGYRDTTNGEAPGTGVAIGSVSEE